jgi:hypothetical protein
MYDNLSFFATLSDYNGLYNFLSDKGYKIFKGDTEFEYKSFKKLEKDLLKNSKGIFNGIALNVNVSHPNCSSKEIAFNLGDEKIIDRNGLWLNIGTLSCNNNISNAYIEYPDLDEYLNKIKALQNIFPEIKPQEKDWEACLIILEDVKLYLKEIGRNINGYWVLNNALKTDLVYELTSNNDEYENFSKNIKKDYVVYECDEIVRRRTWTGFENPNDIFKYVNNKMEIEHPELNVEKDILKSINRHFDRKMKEELRWHGKTDTDRLDKCFESLKLEDDIYTKQNFTNCLTDGNYEIIKSIENDSNRYSGYAYFHKQDLERAIDYNCLFIAYGSVAENNSEAIKIGNIVFKKLKKYGFKPKWSGSINDRIKIGIDWKKRMFT